MWLHILCFVSHFQEIFFELFKKICLIILFMFLSSPISFSFQWFLFREGCSIYLWNIQVLLYQRGRKGVLQQRYADLKYNITWINILLLRILELILYIVNIKKCHIMDQQLMLAYKGRAFIMHVNWSNTFTNHHSFIKLTLN